MNYKVVFSIIGKTLIIEAVLMLFPVLVGFIYQENNYLSFVIPIAISLAAGIPLATLKSKDNAMYAKEGFVTVSLTWILLSLIGAIPFVLSGEIPNYIDAVFETVSGFTTTGSSILTSEQVDNMSRAHMFWRLFTHWIGGMGILVFVLAIMPANNAGVMHVFRTESPGPSVGKLSSKLRFTARILYGIYIVMTVIVVIFLLFGGLPFYDSLLLAFGTAGTGGFAIESTNATAYSSYVQVVLSVGMFLFSLNFNVYFLLLIGQFKKIFEIEEVRAFIVLVVVATLAIAFNLYFAAGQMFASFGDALKHSFFQVTSISSTTGLSSHDFNQWPDFSKVILVILTAIGACGGSTGGGIKMSRILILGKSSASEFKRLIHSRAVVSVNYDGAPLDNKTERNVRTFFIVWVIIVAASTLLLTLDSFGGWIEHFTATLACIGNVGPGFGAVGPMSDFSGYSDLATAWLSFVMLVGRLEIFPMLMLFVPRTWRKS